MNATEKKSWFSRGNDGPGHMLLGTDSSHWRTNWHRALTPEGLAVVSRSFRPQTEILF